MTLTLLPLFTSLDESKSVVNANLEDKLVGTVLGFSVRIVYVSMFYKPEVLLGKVIFIKGWLLFSVCTWASRICKKVNVSETNYIHNLCT